jgi:alpha-methylacyl-CoA racemase
MSGPLKGLKILEIAAIGPAPFCAMMLADMGAEVVRIDRKGDRPRAASGEADVLQRGRRSIALDLKCPGSAEIVLRLAERSHVLIEGFRPGVMERLGLGPEVCFARNQKLVYGRMSGWGQDGPLAPAAGHDINYLALSGALHAMGASDQPPLPPLNLIADFGGGGMLFALGLVCATWEAERSNQGQVVDAAMSDGAALLMSMLYGYAAMGRWNARGRAENFLDGSAPFYGCYTCKDGRFIAVGAIEPQFYARVRTVCGLEADTDFDTQWETERWPQQKKKLAEVFRQRTRDEWVFSFADQDACVTPVLDMVEAPLHPHNVARRTFVKAGGVVQPSPAPRFSRTTPDIPSRINDGGRDGYELLEELSFSKFEIDCLRKKGSI